jgi:RNA polymerase sigma-70 factor (ECF subfamily)
MQISDHELIKRCQKKKDLKAFETLIKRHQNKVRAVIYKLTINTEDLDDISQETFIKAFRSINSFKGNASFSTWLCSIAINTCKDRLRSKNRQEQNIIHMQEERLKEIPDNNEDSPDRQLSLSEDKQLVFKEIQKLPDAQKIALILHDIESFSYEEIATISNCPVGTVKSRLFNARKTIKEKLKPIISSIHL